MPRIIRVVLSVSLLATFASTQTVTATAQDTDKKSRFKGNDSVALYSGMSDVPLCVNHEALIKFMNQFDDRQSAIQHDMDNRTQAVFYVETGTPAVVVEEEAKVKIDEDHIVRAIKVRISTGPETGRSGWIPTAWVRLRLRRN